jgi:hypothetical protein
VEYTDPVNYITMVEALKNGPPHPDTTAEMYEQQTEAAAAIWEVTQ